MKRQQKFPRMDINKKRSQVKENYIGFKSFLKEIGIKIIKYALFILMSSMWGFPFK